MSNNIWTNYSAKTFVFSVKYYILRHQIVNCWPRLPHWQLFLCSVYVILFPELVAVVHLQFTTKAGAIAGYFVGESKTIVYDWSWRVTNRVPLGLVVRIALGEDSVGLPALVRLPGYDSEHMKQYWPIRTTAMVVTLVTIIVVSLATNRGRAQHNRDSVGIELSEEFSEAQMWSYYIQYFVNT